MRILLDARTVGKQFSGVGNYVLELVRAFGRLDADLEVTLLVHGPTRLDELDLDRRFRLVRTTFSHENHPLGDVWEHWILPRFARKRKIDVVHGPAFLIPTGRTAVARVVTVHDLVAFSHPETIPVRYAAYMRWLIRRAVRAADRTITVSETVKSEVIRVLGTDPSRIDAILHGVAERFFPRETHEIRTLRERYGLDRPYLLFVGNLEPRKNLPRLVEAFRTLRHDSLRGVELVVSGQVAWLSGSLLPALNASDLADDIRQLGHVPAEDLPALYSGAEAFVFPTLSEGFGLPVLEAMACGAPVVTSRRSAIPEVAGSAAVLVDPESSSSIADGIRELMSSRETLELYRQRGLERARTFTWETTARNTHSTYIAAHRSKTA